MAKRRRKRRTPPRDSKGRFKKRAGSRKRKAGRKRKKTRRRKRASPKFLGLF